MIIILLIPVITAIACYMLRNRRLIEYASLAGSACLLALSLPLIVSSVSEPARMLNNALYMDALSGYIMAIVVFLGFASALYSVGYIRHEFSIGLTDIKGIRRYYALLHLFIFTMVLVTVSNNLALMWIAIEATTIVSALLIGLSFRKRHLAIEAAWKYIILCTVGITFALLGVFIAYYASTAVMTEKGVLDWTSLREIAARLNPHTMRLAFIFIMVGYGTKAGLAPVHNWLPDAHSQAPSPISALLSGILLNTSFYGVMRFASVVEPSTGSAFTGGLLMLFGLISIGLSSIFMLVQSNYKRLLAYSSIEHMGIVSLGMGIGGLWGVYGSLLHILNHALSKPLMFFAAGKIQARYGSTKIENVTGVLTAMPLLGALTFIGALSLSGTPPFNIFLSEFIILRAGVDKGMWWTSGLFLFFAVIVFYGMLSGFGRMLFGSPSQEPEAQPLNASSSDVLSNGLMAVMAALIIILGIRIPDFLDKILMACAGIIGVK